ncbi:PEP-CTERM sorting domain-containing protein [Coleofasciculus sp. F4-SAH-05]|uniref:PEP-CTERM sorting domain-containing protein n=1 Tax=Coleofasciculus sp. F4-SAH-05 TaxID=3069525 RepID=UPI0032F8D913
MKIRYQLSVAIAGASALVLTTHISTAQAFSVFFGEDLNVGGNGNTPLSSFPNSSQAEADFLSKLKGVGTEDFEGFNANQKPPLNLTFPGAGTATLSGAGSINTGSSNDSTNGAYPISGNQNYVTVVGDGGFTANLDQPVAAFGFYLTDLSDQVGTQLNLEFGFSNGTTKNLVVPNTISPRPGSGSVVYYGVIADNPSEVFTNVSFTFANNGNENEGVGMDDITIGSLEQVENVPEPLTILGSATALGIGGLLKKESSKKQKKS